MSNETDSLERQLRALTPATPDLDRAETLFRMGQASAPAPCTWPWQVGMIASSLLALTFALAWWVTLHAPPIVIVQGGGGVPLPPPVREPDAPLPEPLAAWTLPAEQRELPSNRRLEDQIARIGLEGVPPAPPAPRTPTLAEILQSLNSFDPSAGIPRVPLRGEP
jgi:hypothetical protein